MDSRLPHDPDASPADMSAGGTGLSGDGPRPFEFRWRKADGKVTVLNCLARTVEEAEESARRAGWPGHDGSRLGQYRAWLRQAVLSDAAPAPPPAEPDAVVPGPVRSGRRRG